MAVIGLEDAAPEPVFVGLEFDSTLGFPGEGPPTVDEVTMDNETWVAACAEQIALIEAMPIVIGTVGCTCGEEPNNNKVWATVNCCWMPARRSFKQIHDQCTKDGKKPSHLEALIALREKLGEHTVSMASIDVSATMWAIA